MLPGPVERIGEVWLAHQSVTMLLGASPLIVATLNRPDSRPWMFRIQPLPSGTVLTRGDSFSVESLLARHTGVVFISAAAERAARQYEQAGLPVLRMGFSDLAALGRSVTSTARALNTPEALERATAYNQYLEETLREIRQQTDTLTEAQRPRVLHIASLDPLRVDGSQTLIDEWIRLAGGRNAARSISGNLQPVTLEQLLVWQPDVIILAAAAGPLDRAPRASLLHHLAAVKAQRVLRNPDGVFPWDRYGTEAVLQLQWAARQLHPERFPSMDLEARTRDFYQRFFDYSLSAKEARQILSGQPPAP